MIPSEIVIVAAAVVGSLTAVVFVLTLKTVDEAKLLGSSASRLVLEAESARTITNIGLASTAHAPDGEQILLTYLYSHQDLEVKQLPRDLLDRVTSSATVRSASSSWGKPNDYRKREGAATWHFCKNCSGWPTTDYVVSDIPPSGELCNECVSKDRAGNCL